MAQLDCPLARQLQRRPTATALIERQCNGERRRISFEQLNLEVNRYCNWLDQNGLTPGQRLAVMIDDKAELIRWLLACLRHGTVLVPINPAFPEAQRQRLLQQCQPRLVVDRPLKLGNTCTRSSLPPTALDAERPLTGLFTSGSGGQPKLVVHNYRQHHASAQASQELISLGSEDGWGLSLPLFHISGLSIVIRCLNAGAQLVVPAADERLEQLLRDPALTHLSAVATQLIKLQRQLYDFRPGSLKQLLLGGSPLPESLLNWLSRQPFNSWISYGMTELASQVATGPVNPQGRLAQLLPHCQLGFDPQQQILIRSESLMLGYFIDGQIHCPVDNDGWFATGDLGHWDPQQGLSVSGRQGLQFISGGENIQPELVERLICQHPQIVRCILVPVDDPLYGQRPVALIDCTTAVDPLSLANWAKTELAPHQRPKAWLALPTDDAKIKPDRKTLQHWAQQQLL